MVPQGLGGVRKKVDNTCFLLKTYQFIPITCQLAIQHSPSPAAVHPLLLVAIAASCLAQLLPRWLPSGDFSSPSFISSSVIY
jgi:hypothetical protein